ncbi:MAG TPA: DUF350 domain-containing protein [Candidatus Saccharimonadales bacterium]|nr:DUF350 domain-containing protein [Candidatus Saccharimonadales bacterium]
MNHPLKSLRGIYGDLPTVHDTLVALGKLGIILVLVAIAWSAINALTTDFKDHHEIIEQRNAPFTLIRASMLVGQVVATVPLVSVKSDNTALDFQWLVCGGLGIILAFNIVLRPVLDLLLYGKLRSANALRDASLAHAIVQSSFYLSLGLIIGGAFTGAAPSVSVAVRSTLLFTGLGLLMLVIAYLLVGTFYGMRSEINTYENKAAALILGSVVIGLGFMLNTAIAGDFTGWANALIGFGIYAVVGTVVLLVLVPLLGRLALRKSNISVLIKGNQWLAAAVTGTVIVLVAMAMSSIVI